MDLLLRSEKSAPLTFEELDGNFQKIQDEFLKIESRYVTPEQFGAIGDGVTNDTSAFEAAKEYLHSLGGGVITCSKKYAIKNLIINRPNIVIEGTKPSFSYDIYDSSVKLTNTSDADFILFFSWVGTHTTFGASQGSGFKNLLIKETGTSCEHGVITGCGATIMEDSSVQGFDYGTCMADAANANEFKNFSSLGSRKCNFAITNHNSMGFLYPFLSPTLVSHTAFSMQNCVFRVGQGFGMVIQAGVNVDISSVKSESNKMGGLYILRMNDSTIRNIDFNNFWLENNYEDYTSGTTTYSIASNKMFWVANNTPIVWSSADNAGFQATIDSQTRTAGAGGDNITFKKPTIAGASTGSLAQKGVQILSAINVTLDTPWLSGGNQASFFDIKPASVGFKILDPIQDNDPTALVPSLTSGNMGTRGCYIRTGNNSAEGDLGGIYPEIGVFGGLIHFPDGSNTKPYHDDPRVLDDYRELNEGSFNLVWRQGGATPFVTSSQVNRLTKIGRQVTLDAKATLTANATTGGVADLWITDLPYPIDKTGGIVGTLWIQASGGGATVLLSNTLMYAPNNTFIASIANVFPVLEVGYVYTVSVQVTYFATT